MCGSARPWAAAGRANSQLPTERLADDHSGASVHKHAKHEQGAGCMDGCSLMCASLHERCFWQKVVRCLLLLRAACAPCSAPRACRRPTWVAEPRQSFAVHVDHPRRQRHPVTVDPLARPPPPHTHTCTHTKAHTMDRLPHTHVHHAPAADFSLYIHAAWTADPLGRSPNGTQRGTRTTLPGGCWVG